MINKVNILRLVKRLLAALLVSMSLTVLLVTCYGVVNAGIGFFFMANLYSNIYVEVFSVLFFVSIAFIVINDFYDFVARKISKTNFAKSLKLGQRAKWTYEIKIQVKTIFSLSLFILAVIIVSIELFVLNLNLFSPTGSVRLLIYYFIFPVGLAVNGFLSSWTKGIDAVLYWMDKFLSEAGSSDHWNVDYIGKALQILSNQFPDDFPVDVSGILYELRRFVLVAPDSDANATLSSLKDFRSRVSNNSMPEALSALSEARERFSGFIPESQKIFKYKPSLLTRISGGLRTEKFWVALYAIITLFIFLMELFGFPFRLP
jgi:hypothetical protein